MILKERYTWFGILALIISPIAVILTCFKLTFISGASLLFIALILSLSGLIINFRNNHFLSLVALVVSFVAINSALGIKSIKIGVAETKKSYRSSSYTGYHYSNDYDEGSSNDYDEDSSIETQSGLPTYKVGQKVKLSSGTIIVNYANPVDENYLDINITFEANKGTSLNYDIDDFGVNSEKEGGFIWGIHNTLAADDLGETKFKYLDSGNIMSEKSVTGDLLHDQSDDKGNYLVVRIAGKQKFQIDLNSK